MGDRCADLMFTFLERMRSPLTTAQLRGDLQTAIQAFGLDTFAIAYLPNPGESMYDIQTLHTWSEAWAARYRSRDYAFVDPVLQRVRISDDPYLWSEAIEGQPLRPRSQLVIDEAREFGMCEGFTIPIRTARGFEAIVTMGSQSVHLSPPEKGALHMIGLYAHAKLLEICGGTPERRRSAPKLTGREVDCIKWCAEGKSSWEISQILGIAKKTVDQYLSMAAGKLDCTTRPHLVAEALRLRMIA